MKTVVIIPARYDSKRLPGKALADIDGESVIRRVVIQAKQAEGWDEVYVATDHKDIYDSVTDLCHAVMTSSECRSGTDRCAEAANQLGLAPDDLVVNVQGDMPFIDPKLITELIHWSHNSLDPGLAMGTPALVEFEGETKGMVCVVTDSLSNALYFSRYPLATAPGKHLLHMGLYVYKNSALQDISISGTAACEDAEKLEQLRALYHGYEIGVMETDLSCGQEINTPEDLATARAQ